MSPELLVVEADATPSDASVHGLLAAEESLRCRRVSWEMLARRDWYPDAARGLVAVAVPHTPAICDAFQRLRQRPFNTPTFAVVSPHADESFLNLVSDTVDDFLVAPVRAPELHHRLKRLLGAPPSEGDALRERLLEEMAMTQLVGRDPAFLNAVAQVPRFARSGMSVLITGETGTGKELCARAIHHLSPRRDFPFVAVDCGALPDDLIENELFGHARGAYTDAHRDQKGLVSIAEGGAIFLDEIDGLSLVAQSKLLRFLQERTYRPLGGERFERANVNVIAATNRELETAVAKKQFRADLFYRLNVLRLHLPALRERLGDIPVLANHFLERARVDTQCKSFSAAALHRLSAYDWPGNVREFANVIQRALVLCEGDHILPCHVTLGSGAIEPPDAAMGFRDARGAVIAAFERRYIEDLLGRHKGNITHAAREAGKERRAFGRLVKKHGLDKH